MKIEELKEKAKLLRYYILLSTTKSGSGHPTSCLSAVEIVTSLFFGGFFKFNLNDPKNIANDRFVLSKGHSAPLLYSLYFLLGYLDEKELLNLRKFKSALQGHPVPDNFLVDIATGSLGQGLSIGLGMAMGIKLKVKSEKSKVFSVPKIWVLLGDSEIAEGQIWEAVQLAGFYQVDNLIAIADINRLGQRGETMLGWHLEKYKKRFNAFDWEVFLINDGHNFFQINEVYQQVLNSESQKPKIILAKTVKGKGISFLENKENWHGKSLKEEDFNQALKELGEIKKIKIKKIAPKKLNTFKLFNEKINLINFKKGDLISTRKAFGLVLENLGKINKNLVVLDAEVSNSTFTEFFKNKFPNRFFEMFIAEQNMISCALGFSKIGFIPFCASFSAFLTRAFDQIRMAGYSNGNLKIIGSHAGVSIGEDGVSQMGLEDLAMMRTIFDSVVFYPCDAISTQKLIIESLKCPGIVYLRTTRGETPVIYDLNESFEIGGFKILQSSQNDQLTLITAGVTVFEALKAYEELKKEDIFLRIIDLYCIKPINKEKLIQAIGDTKKIITVEDHYLQGGLGEVVSSVLSENGFSIYHLAVKKMPRSGKKEELLAYEEINSEAIIAKIKKIFGIDKKINDEKIFLENNKYKKLTLNNVLKKLEDLTN